MQFLLCCSNSEVLTDSPLNFGVGHFTSSCELAGGCWPCRAWALHHFVLALLSPCRGGGAFDPSAAHQNADELQRVSRRGAKFYKYSKQDNYVHLQATLTKKNLSCCPRDTPRWAQGEECEVVSIIISNERSIHSLA